MSKKLDKLIIIIILIMICLIGCQEKDPSFKAICSANPTKGTVPLTVNFKGLSNYNQDSNEKYFWDFGDGSTSIEQNPTHTYYSTGRYNVSFSVMYSDKYANHTISIEILQSSFNIIPIDDAYVNGRKPEENYGNSYLDIDYYDLVCCDDWKKQTYIKFDLSNIPKEIKIKNAKLKLYCWYVHNLTTIVRVRRIQNISWIENNITWKNQPDFSLYYGDKTSISKSHYWYEWNVTSYVIDALSTGKITFLLDSKTDLGYISFHSKELENSPELYINIIK